MALHPRQKHWLTALVANEKGEIFDLEGYAAAGMAGAALAPLTRERTRDLPFGKPIDNRLPRCELSGSARRPEHWGRIGASCSVRFGDTAGSTDMTL